ncbi:MAG: 50S ribosomal protein L11 methyltransferase [Firmicutes bacterium]|nr:50S ribosomal protein L11 methyltransferase [Bacillota bacterium]
MKYKKLSIKTTSEASEIVANRLFECGALGVEIKDSADVLELIKSGKHWDYIDESLITNMQDVFVIGFFDYSADLDAVIANILELKSNNFYEFGVLEINQFEGDSSEYENEWKKYYNPITIDNVCIVPEWLKDKCMDDKLSLAPPTNIYLDPGCAFGTGSHETTAMCIELMQKLDFKDKVVLDLGCGSGILGITALKLGAKKCYFVDIDPIATKSSLENAKLNSVEDKAEFITAGFDVALSEKADILLANLTADLLLTCYPRLENLLTTNSQIIISGMLKELEQNVLNEYSKLFAIVNRQQRNDWIAMRLKVKEN